jgi:adenosine deaminase
VEDHATHPLNFLRDSGVSLSLSTDTRAVSDTDLGQEYDLAQRVFGWSLEDLVVANLQAVEASFASPPVKARLRSLLEQVALG